VRNKAYVAIVIALLSIFVSTVGLAASPTTSTDTAATTTTTAPSKAPRPTYSFNFIDEDIRVVLHTLSKISGVDMVIDDSIKGTITMKLNNVYFTTALNLITSAKGLSYRKVDNSIIIEPADLGVTEVIKLQHIRGNDIKKTLEPIATNLKLKIEIDVVSNTLIVTGSPAGCARVKEMLKNLDVLQKQVIMEAKVVAIKKTDAKSLGVDWTWSGQESDTSSGTVHYGVRNISGEPYVANYTVTALISKGDAKILASPKVTTISGNEAYILIGDRIPVMTSSTTNSSTTTSVEYVDAGIKLTYLPTITADGMITAKVRTEISTPSLVASIGNYQITTRQAETTVCMKDGETMVIGGLIGTDDTKNISKVPFLSDLPLLGSLFKSVANSKTETEVIIFLTAKIVK